MNRRCLSVLVAVAGTLTILVFAASAQTDEASARSWIGETLEKCCFGGDIRIRQVYFDDIPQNSDARPVVRGGDNHFFRFRTRLWGQIDPMENVTAKIRLVNEFREYDKPDGQDFAEWPDEVAVGKLWLAVNNIFDGNFDLKIGRQDMIYGTGKVILEGTPLDGSRTIFMDAVKLTYKGSEWHTVDVFGIYNEPENDLAIDSEEYNLNGILHPVVDKDRDRVEKGLGVYVKDKSIDTCPLEYYYLFKQEDSFDEPISGFTGLFKTMSPDNDWVTADEDAEMLYIDEYDLHTFGARVMPTLTEGVSAAVEAAYQVGERGNSDAGGYMIDALLKCMLPGDMKPTLSLGWYYLSGDDPDSTDEDEGWNPLWARWPQYSELYIYAFDLDAAGRWSNVSMPHVDLALACPKTSAKIKAMLAYMEAPENDGPGPGDERGWLGTLRVDFPLAQGVLGEKDKVVAHVVGEYIDPGDYYADGMDDSFFARWELMYIF